MELQTTGQRARFQILSGSTLKLLAIIIMLIDHIGVAIVYRGYLLTHAPIVKDTSAYQVYLLYQVLRFIGRSAFPIFCFLLVEGFLHTSNRQKYALRLLLFAFLSELPFDLALNDSVWDISSQNVYFTLFIGLCVIWIMDYLRDKALLLPFVMLLGMGLAYLLKTDYSYWGVLLIGTLYIFRNQRGLQTLAGCVCLFWEAPACLAFIPLNMYNGKRGIPLKYFFYLFYPVHLLLLAGIRWLCFSG